MGSCMLRYFDFKIPVVQVNWPTDRTRMQAKLPRSLLQLSMLGLFSRPPSCSVSSSPAVDHVGREITDKLRGGYL